MATGKINIERLKKIYEAEDGNRVPYQRLRLWGYINGELLEVELKASPAEMTIIMMLVNGGEDIVIK